MEKWGFQHLGHTHFKNPTIMDPTASMADRMAAFVKELQEEIVLALEKIEADAASSHPTKYLPPPKLFLRDTWERPEKGTGGGTSCVLQDGRVFERGGVMTTVMRGMLTPASAAAMRSRKPNDGEFPDTKGPVPYFAAGISIVIHPHSPFAPTAHMNYRYFEIQDPKTNRPVTWWFGGGADLTPNYLDDQDAIHFHTQLKAPCDRHLGVNGYPDLKKWCDEYFYLPHRNETRGVGGIFFDDLDASSPHAPRRLKALGNSKESCETLFAFVRDAGRAFVPAYAPLIVRHLKQPYTLFQKEWQQLRRGRYVEFNLVIDRGTKFGLATPNARIESILVSLPRTAKWDYYHTPASGSPEDQLLQVLRYPRDWLGERV
jgi:coproporphyrinogen III oxidase